MPEAGATAAESAPAGLRGAPAPRALLAFDYGERRVGVAVGNTLLRQAQPLRTLDVTGDARFSAIGALLQEWRPDALVVGVPFHPDGAEHENTRRARRFARQLQGRFGLPVFEVDERWSTTEAQADAQAHAHGPRAGYRAGHRAGQGPGLDAQAAAVILDQYLRTEVADAAP